MNQEQISAVYNGRDFDFPVGTTVAVMKASLTAMFPELTNGSYRELSDGTIEFYVVAQNKSADITAVYNGRDFDFPAGTTVAVMKASLTAMFPELTNGSYRELSDGTIEFYVVAQNKSADITAVYNGRDFDFPAGTTVAVMKASLTAMFPELTNGSYRELSDGTIEFYVVAQNKSADITAVYNGRDFDFPAGTTVAVMKASLAAMFPELTNGSYRELSDGTIEFYVVAQNKSADITAVYNGRDFDFPAGTTVAVMKASLAAMFPELTNGSYRELSDGTIEFYVVAQNKSK